MASASTSASNGSLAPPTNPDTLHDIHFGASFWQESAAVRDQRTPHAAQSLVSIRYSTKPGSLDNSQPGKIWASSQTSHANGSNNDHSMSLYATFGSTSNAAASSSALSFNGKNKADASMAGLHGFVGKVEDTKMVDCVLVWDDDLQSFALERVNYSLKFTFDRENQHVPSASASTSPTTTKRMTSVLHSSPKLGSSPVKRSRVSEDEREGDLIASTGPSAVPEHMRGRSVSRGAASATTDYYSASEDGMDWRTAPNSPASSRAGSQKRSASARAVAVPEVEDFGEMSFGEDSKTSISQSKDRPNTDARKTTATARTGNEIHSTKNVRFESPSAASKAREVASSPQQASQAKFEKALNAPADSVATAAGSVVRKRSTSPKKGGNRPSVARKSVPHGAILVSSSEDEEDEDDDSSASGSSDGASEGGLPEGYLVKPGSVLSTGVAKKSAAAAGPTSAEVPKAAPSFSHLQKTASQSRAAPPKPAAAAATAAAAAAPPQPRNAAAKTTTTARPNHPQVSMKTAVIPSMVYQALKDSDESESDDDDDDDDSDDDESDSARETPNMVPRPTVSAIADTVHSSPNRPSGIGKGKGGPRRASKIPSRSSYASKIPKSSTMGGQQVVPGMRGQKGLMAAQNEVKRREEMEADLLPDSSDED
ncbi:hypothetical protein ACM66B_005338 [Microbotryomycetes sp. NB124-2]